MNAAPAMNFETFKPTGARDLHAARFAHWRREVEIFKTAEGARCLLEHVGEDVWRLRYAANDDAYSAVVEELERVSD